MRSPAHEPTRNDPALAQGFTGAPSGDRTATGVDGEPGGFWRVDRNDDPRPGALPATVRRLATAHQPGPGRFVASPLLTRHRLLPRSLPPVRPNSPDPPNKPA